MGTRYTLQEMARLARTGIADPDLRLEILQLLGWMDLDALDRKVRGHFHYRSENEEVLRTPQFMWSEWKGKDFFEGDCDDVSMMLATIAGILNYRVRYVAIRYDDENFKHVYVEIFDGHQWRVFDPTVEPGTDYRAIERMVEPV